MLLFSLFADGFDCDYLWGFACGLVLRKMVFVS